MELRKNFGESGEVFGDVGESIAFTINDTSHSVIIDSLINLYSDPIGSVVREITSNCVDAHRERDLKKLSKRTLDPTDLIENFSDKNIIEIEYTEGNALLGIKQSIIFRDYGIGLSHDRVRETFTVFGSSTKRNDNFEIGGL